MPLGCGGGWWGGRRGKPLTRNWGWGGFGRPKRHFFVFTARRIQGSNKRLRPKTRKLMVLLRKNCARSVKVMQLSSVRLRSRPRGKTEKWSFLPPWLCGMKDCLVGGGGGGGGGGWPTGRSRDTVLICEGLPSAGPRPGGETVGLQLPYPVDLASPLILNSDRPAKVLRHLTLLRNQTRERGDALRKGQISVVQMASLGFVPRAPTPSHIL